MKIKSQKDFFSGLMFTVVGASFAYVATNYSIGSGGRMGRYGDEEWGLRLVGKLGMERH